MPPVMPQPIFTTKEFSDLSLDESFNSEMPASWVLGAAVGTSLLYLHAGPHVTGHALLTAGILQRKFVAHLHVRMPFPRVPST